MTATRSKQMSPVKKSALGDDGEDGKKRVLRRLSRRAVGFLLLNVHAGENHLCDAETLQLSAESVNRAFASLRRAFSTGSPSSDVGEFSADDGLSEYAESPSRAVDEVRVSHSALLSRYLEDHRLMDGNSLCKRMTKIATVEPVILAADRSLPVHRDASENQRRSDLQEITSLLAKLRAYLSRQRRRLETPSKPSGRQSSTCTQTPSSILCDKGIQCSRSAEFLKVSPELKFFSRSSLVMNVESDEKKSSSAEKQRRRNSSTSLEYVANYRPEFRRNLRSFSSSALFGPRASTRPSASPRKIRPRRRLKDSIRQTENEFLRYSNFVEDDLVSIRRQHRKKSRRGGDDDDDDDDVLAMKRVLLEDYITEVKEIIHSESRRLEEEREARILESVKSRMEQDLPAQTDSWCSLEDNRRSCASYETARCCCCQAGSRRELSCCCCCCCLGEGDRLPSCEALVLCAGCSLRARRRIARVKSCASCGEDKAAKSSRSVDSGVLLDCPSRRADCSSTDDNKGRKDEIISSGNNDELLCQRVENAVRKFTEELILCERRTRDRSRSTRRSPMRCRSRTPSTTTTTDQSGSAALNRPRNSSDEEDNIAGISTPSLVSLSDSEELPSS